MFRIIDMKTKDSSWQVKFWRVPHLDNLELLHVSNVTHDYPRHIHEEYSVALILQGSETTTCRGVSVTAFPGFLQIRGFATLWAVS